MGIDAKLILKPCHGQGEDTVNFLPITPLGLDPQKIGQANKVKLTNWM